MKAGIITLIVAFAWGIGGFSIGYGTATKCKEPAQPDYAQLKRIGNLSYQRGYVKGILAYNDALKYKYTGAELLDLYIQRDSLFFALELDSIFNKLPTPNYQLTNK